MIRLNEEGQPVHRCMEIQHLEGKLKGSSKVKYTQWAADPHPWKEWPVKSDKMHTTSETHYFYDLAKKSPEGDIANLGVGKGISVGAFAYGLRDAGKTQSRIYGVDLFNHVTNLNYFVMNAIVTAMAMDQYITLIEGTTQDVAKQFESHEFGILLVDADHHYETANLDVKMWSPMLKVGGIMIFHDVDMNTIDRVVSELDPKKWELVDHVYRIKSFRRLR